MKTVVAVSEMSKLLLACVAEQAGLSLTLSHNSDVAYIRVLLAIVTRHQMAHLHNVRKLSYAICEQQRRRSACASAQSDQRLCCSLLR